MQIYISLGVDNLNNKLFENLKIIRLADVLIKYNFDFLKDRFELRLKYLAEEISKKNHDIIVLGTPCYNLEDFNLLNLELNLYNLSITGIFLPSTENLGIKKTEEIKFVNEYNRWVASSEQEVINDYIVFSKNLVKIKRYCLSQSIKITEV